MDPSFPEATDIVSWAKSKSNDGEDLNHIIDPSLRKEFINSTVMEEVSKVILVALRCTAKEAGGRPSMRDVVKQLIDVKTNVSR